MAVLVVEQNIGVATSVSEQRRHHGQRPHQPRHGGERARRRPRTAAAPARRRPAAHDETTAAAKPRRRRSPARAASIAYARGGEPTRSATASSRSAPSSMPNQWGLRGRTDMRRRTSGEAARSRSARPLLPMPLSERLGRTALVVGTFDTKGRELRFLRDRLLVASRAGEDRRSLDVGQALARRRRRRRRWRHASARLGGGVLRRSRRSVDGDGGGVRALDRRASAASAASSRPAAPAARRSRPPACGALPVGMPKVMVSTVASGQVARLCRRLRHHDAPFGRRRAGAQLDHRAGARQRRPCARRHDRRRADAGGAGGAAQARAARRRHHHVRRHDAGRAGGHAAARSRLRLPGVPRHRHRRALDGEPRRFRPARRPSSTSRRPRSPTCWSAACSPADRDRFGAAIRTGLPCVVSVGAMDMVNFGPRDTVPERFRSRRFVVHNPERHADAHHAARRTAPSANGSASGSTRCRAGALAAAGRRRFAARRAGPAVP